MDAVESRKAKRRAYKRDWMRRKRAEARSGKVQYVNVALPPEMAAELAAMRGPKGETMGERIVRLLASSMYSGDPFETFNPNLAPEPSNPRPGRNDPCPCGSGKKFKRCCGA